MTSCAENLSTLRADVFHAAMRVKYNPARLADAGGVDALLLGEWRCMALEVEAVPCGSSPGVDYLINQLVLVRLCPQAASPTQEADALRARLRERGAAMGILVDFSRDLMVDDVVTIMNGSEL